MLVQIQRRALIVPPVGPFQADLSGTENPISAGGKWLNGLQTALDWSNMLTANGRALGSRTMEAAQSRYSDDIAIIDPAYRSFAANQYVETTAYVAAGYTGNSGGHEMEHLHRFGFGDHDAHGYEVLWGITGYFAIVKWRGPVTSFDALYDPGLGSIPVPQTGDVFRTEIVGHFMKVYHNGSLLINFDLTTNGFTTWDTGQPGMGAWPVDGGDPTKYGWSTFEAGDL